MKNAIKSFAWALLALTAFFSLTISAQAAITWTTDQDSTIRQQFIAGSLSQPISTFYGTNATQVSQPLNQIFVYAEGADWIMIDRDGQVTSGYPLPDNENWWVVPFGPSTKLDAGKTTKVTVLADVNLYVASIYANIWDGQSGPKQYPASNAIVDKTRKSGLTNSSVLLKVTPDSAAIGGFVVTGSSTHWMLVRAAGPALDKFGLQGQTVKDPTIQLFDAKGNPVVNGKNNDWAQRDQWAFAATGAYGYDQGSKDSAIVVPLSSGAYTFSVSGSGGTGYVQIEVYELPEPAASRYHSADTNHDWAIDSVEVARVQALYDYRNGSVRTGEYHTQPGTTDGYDMGPGTIVMYHSADINHDGKIDLHELTRVIELHNASGYYRDSSTEDGFAPWYSANPVNGL